MKSWSLGSWKTFQWKVFKVGEGTGGGMTKLPIPAAPSAC
jgi:hypothetical protein